MCSGIHCVSIRVVPKFCNKFTMKQNSLRWNVFWKKQLNTRFSLVVSWYPARCAARTSPFHWSTVSLFVQTYSCLTTAEITGTGRQRPVFVMYWGASTTNTSCINKHNTDLLCDWKSMLSDAFMSTIVCTAACSSAGVDTVKPVRTESSASSCTTTDKWSWHKWNEMKVQWFKVRSKTD